MLFIVRFSLVASCVVFIVTAILLFLVVPGASQAGDIASQKMRSRAWDALRSRVQDLGVLNHSLAVEAMMREMAVATRDEPEQWALAGLLHDIDITTTAQDLPSHGIVGSRILRSLGFSKAVAHAVSAHDDHAGIARTSRLDHALYCADQVYWLIIGTGLRFPSDKVKSAVASSLWHQVETTPGKASTVGKISSECALIGLTMAQVFETALAGLRKVSPVAEGAAYLCSLGEIMGMANNLFKLAA
jgi:putative nucleotidyltransferase with HDIG domain